MLKMELGSEIHLKIVSVRMPDSVELGASVLSKAIELIVEGFTRLRDRQSLEDLRMHRRRLAVDLKSISGFDCRRSIAQIEDDIEVIESGLRSLDKPAAAIAKEV